jgi:hypothetical protein
MGPSFFNPALKRHIDLDHHPFRSFTQHAERQKPAALSQIDSKSKNLRRSRQFLAAFRTNKVQHKKI